MGGGLVSTPVERIDPGANQSVVFNPRALQPEERRAVLDTLHEARFADLAPSEVYATLLDEGRYLCSERTMYRILAENHEVRERRAQLRHPHYAAPELLATRPNQLWSWDITKLLGPTKWSYFHLYVILDVFSRYVVGWMVADRESATLAERLIAETCVRQKIERDQLTLHADRGSSMKSKPVALLLADLGVTKTHSRPHVSNDNPFSESHFKTLKYRPDFPERFGSPQDARRHCANFFPWYNCEHHHAGLGLLTPHDVHYGLAASRHAERSLVLAAAHAQHPERFPRGTPRPPPLPTEVWINKPTLQKETIAQ
jgi:putative transposase